MLCEISLLVAWDEDVALTGCKLFRQPPNSPSAQSSLHSCVQATSFRFCFQTYIVQYTLSYRSFLGMVDLAYSRIKDREYWSMVRGPEICPVVIFEPQLPIISICLT
jgi:hypothetical protein